MTLSWVTLAPWIVTIGLFLFWEAAVWLLGIRPYILPAPSAIFADAQHFAPGLWKNSLQTLWTTLVGFGLAIVFGLALGLAIGSRRRSFKCFRIWPVLSAQNI